MRWVDTFLPMKWTDSRHLLEMGNGVWAIVCVYLVVFLIYHITKVGLQRRIWRKWKSPPLSIQLAIGVWIASTGIAGTRAVTWWSRYSHEGNIDMHDFDTAAYVLFTVIGVIGFMCILRVSTRPMLGHTPWIACLITCAAYIAWSLIRLS